MTFTDIQTEIMDRLNLSSTTAMTRIGRAINRKYRLVTSAIGLQLSRRGVLARSATIGGSIMTFTNCEKVIEVVNRGATPYRTLKQVTIEEIESMLPYPSGDAPTHYAIISQTSNTVTIQFNRVAVTAFVLYGDIMQTVTDLSGSLSPAFPESFHDIIIEGVISDELRKMEKASLAAIAAKEYDRILSDLRMWIAKSNYAGEQFQGKYNNDFSNRVVGGGGGSGSGGGSGDLPSPAIMMRISLRG